MWKNISLTFWLRGAALDLQTCFTFYPPSYSSCFLRMMLFCLRVNTRNSNSYISVSMPFVLAISCGPMQTKPNCWWWANNRWNTSRDAFLPLGMLVLNVLEFSSIWVYNLTVELRVKLWCRASVRKGAKQCIGWSGISPTTPGTYRPCV